MQGSLLVLVSADACVHLRVLLPAPTLYSQPFSHDSEKRVQIRPLVLPWGPEALPPCQYFFCHFPAISPTSLLTSRIPNGQSRNWIYMVLSTALLRHCQLTLHTVSHLKVSGYRKRISSVEPQGYLQATHTSHHRGDQIKSYSRLL